MMFNYAPGEIYKTVFGFKIRVMNAALRNMFLSSYGDFRPYTTFSLPGCQFPGLLWPAGVRWVPFNRQGDGLETLRNYINKPVFRNYGVLVQPFGLAPNDGMCVAMTRYAEDAAAVLARSPSAKLVREPLAWLRKPKLKMGSSLPVAVRGFGQEPGVTLPTLPVTLPPLPGYVTKTECDAQLVVAVDAGAHVAKWFMAISAVGGVLAGAATVYILGKMR